MDERKLQVFCTVAELRNFSRAAQVMHLAQPTVSQLIQGLEEYYGVRLLDRDSKHVELTAAGRELYAHATSLLREFAEVRRAVLQAAGAVEGLLTVGASQTVGEYILPRALSQFLREHPRVEVRLQIQNTEQVVNLLTNGGLDLGLVEGRVDGEDLTKVPFLVDELYLIAPTNHPWRELTRVPPLDLLKERFLLREKGSGTRQVLEEHLQAGGVRLGDLRVVSELTSTVAIKGAVEAGMGVSALSLWAIQNELRLGTLIARPLENLPIRRTLRVIYPRSKTLLPAAAALMKHIQAATFDGGQKPAL